MFWHQRPAGAVCDQRLTAIPGQATELVPCFGDHYSGNWCNQRSGTPGLPDTVMRWPGITGFVGLEHITMGLNSAEVSVEGTYQDPLTNFGIVTVSQIGSITT